MVHTFAGGAFNAFHQGNDEGGGRDQILEFSKRETGELGGDRDDDDIRVRHRLCAVAGGVHVRWKLFDAG